MTLLERITAAEAGSRELDCHIHIAANPDTKIMTDGGGYRGERLVAYTLASELIVGWQGDWEGFHSVIGALDYTTSIDAALSLVPEHCGCNIYVSKDGEGGAEVYNAMGQRAANASTPALAICAAALQARSGA